jgi:hypothetical protein
VSGANEEAWALTLLLKPRHGLCILAAIALLVAMTGQSISEQRELPIKNVSISLIKTKADDDGGTVLYFKIDNNTGSAIDTVFFECNIFDSASKFSEITYPSARRVSDGNSVYNEEHINLHESQFGQAECRGIDAYADDSLVVTPPPKPQAPPRAGKDCSGVPVENRTLDCAHQ